MHSNVRVFHAVRGPVVSAQREPRLVWEAEASQSLSKTGRDRVLLVVYHNTLCAPKVPQNVPKKWLRIESTHLQRRLLSFSNY